MSKRKIDSSIEYSCSEDDLKIVIQKVEKVKCVKLVCDNKSYPLECKTVKYCVEKKSPPSYIN